MKAPSFRRRFDRAVMRALDVIGATLLLVFASPLLCLAAVGIIVSSPGPIFYRAARIGLNGQSFTMLKFRTMHVGTAGQSRITAPQDARIFHFGKFLRRSKIDELPQLFNVVKGEMAFVGPRPEDPTIVDENYTIRMLQSLNVRPGLTSVGTLFYMRNSDVLLAGPNVEEAYLRDVLEKKIAIDLEYLDRQTVFSDLRVIWTTLVVILGSTIVAR